MPTTLITGCDYGIGFELARQYAEDDWIVHAVCLDSNSRSKVLGLAGETRFHCVDVSDQSALQRLADELSGQPIDLLINNAATFAPDGSRTLKLPRMEEFTRVMQVNAVAPVYVADAFENHVAVSGLKLIVFIGTRSGSIGDNSSGGHYAYRSSKAALNMVAKSISIDFANHGVCSVVVHPGSVATETRKGGQVSVHDSVAGIRKVIAGLDIGMTGKFLRYDGGEIEW